MKTIIFKGTLTQSKLKELAAKHLTLSDSDIYNPAKNPKAISIIEQPDGNWKGKALRNGTMVEVRAGDPNWVLQMIVTHDGKIN